MLIRKIEVKNFKGFASKTFFVNPGFTVFIGDNAKGKTSVLDALAIAAGSFLRGIDVAHDEARGINRNEILVKTIDGQPRPQLPSEISFCSVVNGKEMESIISVPKITSKARTSFVGAKNIEKEAENMLVKSRAGGGITFPVLAYHGTGRLWAEHEKKKTEYKKQEEGVAMAYVNCLSPKSSSKEFLSWYKTYEDEVRKFNQDTDKLFLEAFNECVISMIPDNHWKEMAFSFKDDDLVGLFESPEGSDEKLLFNQLSDGYRNIIGMVSDIAYRCIKLNPHLGRNAIKETPGIVLIDEIDLHLHPNWQRRVVSDLKKTFPKIQFIATTHSPFIVQSLESDELRNLDKQDFVEFPADLPLSKVATGIMGVVNIRSDDFDVRYKKAKEQLSEIGKEENKVLSLEDYQKVSDLLGDVLKKETNDPVYKAYLALKDKDETD
ncbi:MAG: AAA family ATPase [Chlorobium sp.]